MTLGRGFGRLWAGNAAANLGDGLSFVAIPLVATTLTTDPTQIALLNVVYSLARLLVVVPIGVLVDRIDHRTILIFANAVRAAALIGLAVMINTDVVTLPLLAGGFVVVGLAEAASDNAGLSASLALGAATMAGLWLTDQVVVAGVTLALYIGHAAIWNVASLSLRMRLVPAPLRGRINSLFKLSAMIGLVVGAAVAGPLAALGGLGVPYGFAAVIFAGCTAFVALTLGRPTDEAPAAD